MEKQPLSKTYSQLIKFGRLLEKHHIASNMAHERPDIILSFVEGINRQLRFTKVDEFFSLFPPIKRYEEDGTWNYKSTMEMIKNDLGSHFGKSDFIHLLTTHCYENKWLKLVGLANTLAISEMYKRQNGRSLIFEFLDSQQE